jgi:predicted CoA-binding protein
VVVLGASPKPSRYSNQAVKLLKARGYRVTPVHPGAERIEGLEVVRDLADVRDPVHTLTLYVGPQRLAGLTDAVMALRPGRVIFNPGSEWSELERRLDAAGVPWLHACTLVMLRTGAF